MARLIGLLFLLLGIPVLAIEAYSMTSCRYLLKPSCIPQDKSLDKLKPSSKIQSFLAAILLRSSMKGKSLRAFEAVEMRCQCDIRNLDSKQFAAPHIECTRLDYDQANWFISCIAEPASIRSINFYKANWPNMPNLSNFSSLTLLRLVDLGLAKLNAEGFQDLSNLADLELSQNKFRKLPVGLFDGMPQLEELTLVDNYLDSLDRSQFAPRFSRLLKLTIAGMTPEFRTIPPGFFEAFPTLETLMLTNTFLEHIGHLGTLPRLTTLVLPANQIAMLDDNAFAGLYSLRLLDLRKNRLKSLSRDLLSTLLDVDRVWLGGNVLTCDCHVAGILDWSNRGEDGQRRLMDPPAVCSNSSRCGPTCENQEPVEYLSDANIAQLTCTTSSSTTSTTTAPGPILVLNDVLRFDGSSDSDNSSASASSVEFAKEGFEFGPIAIITAFAAAASFVFVIIVTIFIRLQRYCPGSRRARRPGKMTPIRRSSTESTSIPAEQRLINHQPAILLKTQPNSNSNGVKRPAAGSPAGESNGSSTATTSNKSSTSSDGTMKKSLINFLTIARRGHEEIQIHVDQPLVHTVDVQPSLGKIDDLDRRGDRSPLIGKALSPVISVSMVDGHYTLASTSAASTLNKLAHRSLTWATETNNHHQLSRPIIFPAYQPSELRCPEIALPETATTITGASCSSVAVTSPPTATSPTSSSMFFGIGSMMGTSLRLKSESLV